LKLHGEVGIGLDLIYERLSSRLRIQIRCSTLVINPEMKRIKIKDLFVWNDIYIILLVCLTLVLT